MLSHPQCKPQGTGLRSGIMLLTEIYHRSFISSNVLAIRDTVLGIEQAMLMLPGMLSRLTLFKHNVAYIEDALGWNLPILLDSRPSWEVSRSCVLYFLSELQVDTFSDRVFNNLGPI
jgi:hypothetical protein